MSYREILEQDRRLVVLRALSQTPQYKANEYVLRGVLEEFGHIVGTDRLRADLDWLAEQGLVTVEEVGAVIVASITARGADVADGRTRVHGVKLPEPGA